MAEQLMGKKTIRHALLQLMEEKPFRSITVKELSAQAHISRTSFYRHYATQQDVIEDIVDDMLDEIDHERPFLAKARDDIEKRVALYRMLGCLERRKTEVNVILQSDMEPYFLRRAQRYLLDIATWGLQEQAEVKRETKRQARVRHYHAIGLVAVVSDWFAHDCQDPLADLVDFILEMAAASRLCLVDPQATGA